MDPASIAALPFAAADPDGAAHREALDALATGTHGAPFDLLGPHPHQGGMVIRLLRPDVQHAAILDPDSMDPVARLRPQSTPGLFSGFFPNRALGPYGLRLEAGSQRWNAHDPYRFASTLTPSDLAPAPRIKWPGEVMAGARRPSRR